MSHFPQRDAVLTREIPISPSEKKTFEIHPKTNSNMVYVTPDVTLTEVIDDLVHTKDVQNRALANMSHEIRHIHDDVVNLSERVDGAEDRIENVETRVTDVENRVTDVETRVTDVEDRVTVIENSPNVVVDENEDAGESVKEGDVWYQEVEVAEPTPIPPEP